MNNIEYEVEKIELKKLENNINLLSLPKLTEEEKEILDPLVAPTSGLRIKIYDVEEANGSQKYILKRRTLFLFLRFFKAISKKVKEMLSKENPNILIFTDNRPSNKILLQYSSQIFAYEGYQVIYQNDKEGYSRLSAPYGAASVALYDDVDLAIVITASHNELTWNGIKFYIEYPIPISGNIFKDISAIALKLEEMRLKTDFTPLTRNVTQKNNEYIRELIGDVLTIESLKEKDIVIWPYLGKAKEIVELFEYLGANVHLIEETIDPPNPIKTVKEDKLQDTMNRTNSNIALLLDADRDRIALYVKENGAFSYYIPNEIYSAMHNLLGKEYNKKVLNIRTIPSDLRGDESSFLNILTGVGYKHLGVILYFLLDIDVEQSKVDTAILYMQKQDGSLAKIKSPDPLKQGIINEMEAQNLEKVKFVFVMWEESGGHTINIINAQKADSQDNYEFRTSFPLIADKYPVPALVLITELLCRGHIISKSIDWSIKGINQTVSASEKEKIKIMKNFEKENGNTITIGPKDYLVKALSNNKNKIKIYQLKSSDSTLYFRPSGTSPKVRFYIFGDRDSYLEEIKRVKTYIKQKYI